MESANFNASASSFHNRRSIVTRTPSARSITTSNARGCSLPAFMTGSRGTMVSSMNYFCNKKADVEECSEAFLHVGLLGNRPPDVRVRRPLSRLPTISTHLLQRHVQQ